MAYYGMRELVWDCVWGSNSRRQGWKSTDEMVGSVNSVTEILVAAPAGSSIQQRLRIWPTCHSLLTSYIAQVALGI
jgi:hypothetical protein